jgi:hypothetical protein
MTKYVIYRFYTYFSIRTAEDFIDRKNTGKGDGK